MQTLCSDEIRVPRVLGFSSKTKEFDSEVPWEWIVLERLEGDNLANTWDSLSPKQKAYTSERLARIVVSMRSLLTLQSLGIATQSPSLIGNLSLIPNNRESHITGTDHKHFSILDSPVTRIYVSNILNGPPASSSYLEYTRSWLHLQMDRLQQPEIGYEFAYALHLERLPRLRNLQNIVEEHTGIAKINSDRRWKPVFTHGDFNPQNILLHRAESGITDEVDISILDWEWAGFFPPHIEWDAGLNDLTELIGDSDAKSTFMNVLHASNIITPDTADVEDWECAINMSRLIECVMPWWLGGYPADGGDGDLKKAVEEKRLRAVSELDSLLLFFGA